MQIGMTLWQLHYDSFQPGKWNDMWLYFEKHDELVTPFGKGTWSESDENLLMRFPWEEKAQSVKPGMNAGIMLTTFQPGSLLESLLKREQNTPPWGYMMLWNQLKRDPAPFEIDKELKLLPTARETIQPQLNRIAFKFDLLMSSLQTATTSITATEQKWFITKHSFSNQEILKQLAEIQLKLADGLMKIVDELATIVGAEHDLLSIILGKIKNTYTFHTIQIRRIAYMRDPKLGDQIDAGAILSGAGTIARLLSKAS